MVDRHQNVFLLDGLNTVVSSFKNTDLTYNVKGPHTRDSSRCNNSLKKKKKKRREERERDRERERETERQRETETERN